MAVVRWLGRAPDASLARALKAAGVELTRGDAACAVLASATLNPPALPWIWLAPTAVSAADARAAALAGAYDVLDASAADASAVLVKRVAELCIDEGAAPPAPALVGSGAASKRMLAQVARAARTSMPVLLVGETGTGKDVVAHLIHAWSARARQAFVPIHCAAIPNELMEAELFGYAKGAFSGAVASFGGQLVSAAGGTVFLDEIDDTPYSTQVKLLRVLEDHVVTRLGESTPHTVDFRVLAATNRDLRALIDKGAFGRDLYERLAIVTIQLPPLRDRIEDLPALVDHMIARYYVEEHAPRARVKRVSAHALRALKSHAWTGNIRELRNVIFEALVYKRAGDELLVSDLPRRVLLGATTTPSSPNAEMAERIAAGAFNLKDEVAALERNALRAALLRSGGNRAEAARLLGAVGRGTSSDPAGTVRAMMRRLGVSGVPGRGGRARP